MSDSYRYATSHRAAVGAAAAIAAFGLFMAPLAAHADPVEGAITYTGGDATVPSDIARLNVTPAPGTSIVNGVSGSKVATALDASDNSQVTISFPAADYKTNYDIVLVTDATSSFSTVAPQATQMIQDLASQLATRTNTIINVGSVAFTTVAYTGYTPGSGLAWSTFSNAIRNGTLASLLPALALAGIHPDAEQTALITALKAVPGWGTTGTFPNGTPYMPTAASAFSTFDLLGGLKQLTTADAAANGPLASALQANGSAVAVMELLAKAAVTNNALMPALGYTMANPVIGTNLEAGIKAGQAMLAAGPAPAANKFLVIVTDAGTYFWDGASGAPADQLSGGRNDTSQISWGNQLSDWWGTSPKASDGLSYANFLAFTDPTFGNTAATNTTSQISIADYQAYHTNPSAWANIGSLTTSFWDRTTYPFISIERGTAHAAQALTNALAALPSSNVILVGSPYNPSYGTGPGSPYEIAGKWMTWAASQVSPNGVPVQYYPVTTAATDIAAAFDSVVNQLMHAFESGTLTDVIGPEFNLVMAGATLDPADVQVSVNGAPVPGVLNGSEIDYGTADGAGVYPYVLTYAAGTLTLKVNVPIDTEMGLALTYTLHLNRGTTPGWHQNVALNQSATVAFVDSNGNPGSGVFPVPATAYFVPPVKEVKVGGAPAQAPWLVLLTAGLLLAAGFVLYRRQVASAR